MKRVVLISCSKLKRTYPCEAYLLYDASSLFSKSLAYAKTISDELYVLSSKHGLVPMDEIIEPYEETLNEKSAVELSSWGDKVAAQLSARFDLNNTEFIVLAGKNYYQPLRVHLRNMTLPLIGLAMGKRMEKLDKLIKTAVQKNDADNESICLRLHKLFNDMPRFKWDTIDNIGFSDGIYILFEIGETYHGMDRIVRVGTHRSDGRLKRRLKDHFVKENKDGSIFRKNIGKAILNKNNHPYLAVWNVNTSKQENIDRLGSRYDPVFQKKSEDAVSKYMRERFSFACFPVATEQERLRLEEGIIATINRTPDFTASAEWRGKYSTENEIVRSGLWLKQGLDGIPLSDSEFADIANRCSLNLANNSYKIEISDKSKADYHLPLKQSPEGNIKSTSDIMRYLHDVMMAAKAEGKPSIRIRSGTIHKELGLVSRMPMVCGAMRKLMKADDVIHYQPPKGNGATLDIEYFLNIGYQDMVVRLATASDIATISHLYNEFFKYNNSMQPAFCVAAKEGGQYPKNVIDGATGDILVAEVENEIIGFIHVEEDKTPPYPSVAQHRFACIVDFYVIPDHRRRGVGKALLENVKEWAINRKLDYLELFVLEENEIGQRFYEKEDFKTASRTMRFML